LPPNLQARREISNSSEKDGLGHLSVPSLPGEPPFLWQMPKQSKLERFLVKNEGSIFLKMNWCRAAEFFTNGRALLCRCTPGNIGELFAKERRKGPRQMTLEALGKVTIREHVLRYKDEIENLEASEEDLMEVLRKLERTVRPERAARQLSRKSATSHTRMFFI
jgi:hypothetical protein